MYFEECTNTICDSKFIICPCCGYKELEVPENLKDPLGTNFYHCPNCKTKNFIYIKTDECDLFDIEIYNFGENHLKVPHFILEGIENYPKDEKTTCVYKRETTYEDKYGKGSETQFLCEICHTHIENNLDFCHGCKKPIHWGKYTKYKTEFENKKQKTETPTIMKQPVERPELTLLGMARELFQDEQVKKDFEEFQKRKKVAN